MKTHTTKKSLWIIVDDYVFDVTTYMSKHSGGTDCTKHVDAFNYMEDLCVGKVIH